MCLIVFFLRNSVLKITKFFFRVFFEGIQGCTKDWLSGTVILFSSLNYTTSQSRLEISRNSFVVDVIFPTVKNKRVIHQLFMGTPAECPWIARK